MDSPGTLKTTPLHDRHVDLGARMMPFGGFEMPVQYTGIIEEHVAVRTAAGMFDVSHMGEIFVRGPHAFEFVQQLVTNDAARLYDSRAMYTVMCRPDGGIIDDLLVYRINEEEYLLVVNAANIDKDFDWMVQNNPMKAMLDNVSEDVALLAVQGPQSFDIVEQVVGESLEGIDYYHFRRLPAGSFFGSDMGLISHTGYTGERGLEIYCDRNAAGDVWDAVLKAGSARGLLPAGLGARDTLRLEAGFALYGNDIDETTNPLEAGLGWVTKLDKDDFIGRDALLEAKRRGPVRKLIGFVLEDRGIPRHGYAIMGDGEEAIGEVTSGSQSPILQRGIGLGYVPNDARFTEPGSRIYVSARGRQYAAVIRKPPFHKK